LNEFHAQGKALREVQEIGKKEEVLQEENKEEPVAVAPLDDSPDKAQSLADELILVNLQQDHLSVDCYPQARKYAVKEGYIRKAYSYVTGEKKPLIDAFRRAIHLEEQECLVYAKPESFVELSWVV
jgi:hypothetical protein